MGNYEQLKVAIAAVIKANGGQEITGQVLQNTLKTLISQIGVNATFAGIATPSTTPGTPDQNVFWIASTPGKYVNFGGINVGNEVVILQNNNGTWTAKNSGLATEAKVRDLSQNYIFVSSYYNLINPQSVTDFEGNKILLADGSVDVQNNFRVYTITNTVKENVALYVKNDFQNDILIQGTYANMALYDQNNQLVLSYILRGEKIIRVPYRYTLKICTNKGDNPETSIDIVDNKNVIDCIGDSLTAAGKYEEKLKELTGFNVINLGVGGENVGTILGRMNGIPYKVKEKITIPQTTDKVQVKLTNIYNQRLLPLLQGDKTLNVEIRGINGVLTTTQIEAEASTADYFFNRLNGGEQAEINIGENIYISTNKIYQKSERYKIIWVGQNGGFSIDETGRYQGDFNNVQDVKRYISMIKTYLGVINPNKYIVMSPPKKTSDLVENEMEKEFGANYINVRKQMVNNGISLALQYGYLVGNYPTEQDIEDINNNIVPTSLRSDTVHFNQAGYYVLAHIIYDVIKIVWDL